MPKRALVRIGGGPAKASNPTSHVPVRTCVGCRKRGERNQLVRVVQLDGRVVLDEYASLPGRGAWLHHETGCLEKALKRRAFPRALRVEELDVTGLMELLPLGGNQAARGASPVGKAE
ncbi:YlxR family protein [Buchananella felis]|uniref:YlxR family protein n=1 Tax=Buchananella felis TaxID=3231492 RepID=UPI00352801AC